MTTVLIIDDNRKNVELLRDFIESWGYATLSAYQGKEALQIAQEKRPDIILLDVMLPGMSGFEVCRELKDTTVTQNIPVILITALTTPEDRASGFSVGANHFMTKPVSYKELKAILKNFAEEKTRLDSMETQDLVLKKLYQALYRLLCVDDHGMEDERMDFYRHVFKHLGLPNTLGEKVLYVLWFQPIYQRSKKHQADLFFLQDLFQGLKCTEWLRPLVLFSCTPYKDRDPELASSLKAQGLMDIAQLCYEVNRFDTLLQENDFHKEKALAVFKEEQQRFAYSTAFTDALAKELADQELRNRIRQDLGHRQP